MSPNDWRTADFDYALPPELIASRPPERRDAARMLVIDRAAGTLRTPTFHRVSLVSEGR
jgi:S-adenosylmethionine:tRNA ribosyltransferase-isomerase